MSGNREFKEFREFREISPDCTASRRMSPLSRNFDRIRYQSDSRGSVLVSPILSAVICFILKLLILLNFLIVCHVLPHAHGFAGIPNGMVIPGFAVKLPIINIMVPFFVIIQVFICNNLPIAAVSS